MIVVLTVTDRGIKDNIIKIIIIMTINNTIIIINMRNVITLIIINGDITKLLQ